jgi:hypothetical protein
MVGFASALPALRLDSRSPFSRGQVPGNDPPEADAEGLGLRVRNSLESLFDKEGLREFGGIRGLKRAPREGRWVSRPLYPPYTWIPAPRFHEDKFRGNDRTGAVRLRRTGSLRVSLNSPLFLSPKIEDPPQEEWGTKGVEKVNCPSMAPFDIVRLLECEKV